MRITEAAERTGIVLTPQERAIVDQTVGVIYKSSPQFGTQFSVWYIDNKKDLGVRWRKVLDDFEDDQARMARRSVR